MPCLKLILTFLLGDTPDVNVSPFPNRAALVQMAVLGFVIPALSAAGPIKQAQERDLN